MFELLKKRRELAQLKREAVKRRKAIDALRREEHELKLMIALDKALERANQ